MTASHSLARHLPRLALAVALSTASLAAFAEDVQETTEIEITANGQTEKMKVENLRVGETRQFYSEAGTLVTATRTAESLELDVGGDKTSIKRFEPGERHEAHVAALVDGGLDGPRIVRIERHVEHGDAGEPHKVIVISGNNGEVQTLDAHDAHVIVKTDGDGTDGKRIIVKRRIEKSDEAESK